MKACKVKMITMLSAKCVFSQTGMRPNYCKKKGLRIVWCFSVLQFSEFESFFFCGVSARNKNSVLWRSHKQNAYFHYAFKIFWWHFFPFPLTLSFMCLCISVHTPPSYFVSLIFYFFLRTKICVCFPPDWRLRSHSRYSCIPSFCCGVAVNQVCEMEMRTLSLSLTLSLPLFPDIKTRLCLQCFSQILECCQIL